MTKHIFMITIIFAFSKFSLASSCYNHIHQPLHNEPPSIDSLFERGEKIVHVVFSTPTERFNIMVKRITDAWVFHGYSVNTMDFAISKTVALGDKVLIFTKVNSEIYKNIILSTHPQILELSKGYEVTKGFTEHSSKATPDLLQVFSHIEEGANVTIPATILFPNESNSKADFFKILEAIGITDFKIVGESIFTNITKLQFEKLKKLPIVEQLGLQM